MFKHMSHILHVTSHCKNILFFLKVTYFFICYLLRNKKLNFVEYQILFCLLFVESAIYVWLHCTDVKLYRFPYQNCMFNALLFRCSPRQTGYPLERFKETFKKKACWSGALNTSRKKSQIVSKPDQSIMA